jgi:N-acyl-D-amino-acid deacylase
VHRALLDFDRSLQEFVALHRPPGMAVALTASRKLVYARGFGVADREASLNVTPRSLFRVASLSKPITATAVMRLVERGRVNLDDPILRYLSVTPFLPVGKKQDPRWERVTVRHCLQHLGGWDPSRSIDPMGANGNRQIAEQMKVALPVSVPNLIRFMLGRPLDFDPGTSHVYSNFGYLLLGRVIEKAGKMSYEDFVRREVLKPLQITRMRLAKNLREDQADDEVSYYDSRERMEPAVTGPRLGQPAPLPYGIELLESMDANGGWLASAVDLVKFGCAFDDPSACPLLKRDTLSEMLASPQGSVGHEASGRVKEVYYACGWQVRPVARSLPGCTKWHSGGLAGSSTLLVCRHDRHNWCVLFNSDAGRDGKAFGAMIDPLMHQAVDAIKTWPRIDLFPRLLK